MAEFQLPKLATRVRFPSPAPKQNPFRGFLFSLSFGNLCSKLVAFALSLKFSLSHRKSPALLRPLDALASFPSPAPKQNPFRGFLFSLSFGNLCSKLVAFALFFEVLIQQHLLTQKVLNVFLLSDKFYQLLFACL